MQPDAERTAASYDSVHLALVRLDGKIDTLIKTAAVREAAFNQELQRMRETATEHARDHERRLTLYEERLRQLEIRRYVEPRTVWYATGILLTVGSLVVAIINLTVN